MLLRREQRKGSIVLITHVMPIRAFSVEGGGKGRRQPDGRMVEDEKPLRFFCEMYLCREAGWEVGLFGV